MSLVFWAGAFALLEGKRSSSSYLFVHRSRFYFEAFLEFDFKSFKRRKRLWKPGRILEASPNPGKASDLIIITVTVPERNYSKPSQNFPKPLVRKPLTRIDHDPGSEEKWFKYSLILTHSTCFFLIELSHIKINFWCSVWFSFFYHSNELRFAAAVSVSKALKRRSLNRFLMMMIVEASAY